jgi:hypothetical protein
MTLRGTILVLALAVPGVGGVARAQAPGLRLPPVDTAAVAVRLADGSEVVGRVRAANDSSITMLTAGGIVMQIPSRTVVGWTPVRGLAVGGTFRPADPNVSRLFFAPTGRTLAAGNGYFADYYLFFPILAFGVTDRVTVAGGASLIPGATEELIYFTGKVGVVRSPNVNIAIGGLYSRITGESGYAGIGYGVGTFGGEDYAITVGAGYPFANGDHARDPVWMLGGEVRLGGGTKLLAEAWKAPGAGDVPAIFGLRFFGRKVAVDFGLLTVLGANTEGFPFLPWVDFAVKF